MSKADILLCDLVAAADVVDPPRFQAAVAAARAYLNEKPHEPPTDHLMNTAVETATTAATIGKRYRDASPPHAAAEPEKPVAWYMPIGRYGDVHWGANRPDAGNIDHWQPLYASPSAQPIAPLSARYDELLYAVAKRFPGETRHETALRYIREREAPNNDPKAAALKSAGKESTK